MEPTNENEIDHWEVTEEIEDDSKELNPSSKDEVVWTYFDRKDEEHRTVSCRTCDAVLSYKVPANLTVHLLKHDINIQDADETDAGEDVSDIEDSNIKRKYNSRQSMAWKYFKVKEGTDRLAQCLLCGSCCSFRSSVSNLMKHFKRKHIDVWRSNSETSGDSAKKRKRPPSVVWTYFNIINDGDKVALCAICDKNICFGSSTYNLKRHLKFKHPEIELPNSQFKTVQVKQDCYLNKNYDDRDNQASDLDTVYLEEIDDDLNDDTDEPDTVPRKAKKLKIRKYSVDNDENVCSSSTKQSDAIEYFGRYVVSLLRMLPKDKCNRLQAEFISRIMEEI